MKYLGDIIYSKLNKGTDYFATGKISLDIYLDYCGY